MPYYLTNTTKGITEDTMVYRVIVCFERSQEFLSASTPRIVPRVSLAHAPDGMGGPMGSRTGDVKQYKNSEKKWKK